MQRVPWPCVGSCTLNTVPRCHALYKHVTVFKNHVIHLDLDVDSQHSTSECPVLPDPVAPLVLRPGVDGCNPCTADIKECVMGLSLY